jgi:5-methylcytosine-specific restriction enzyme A
MILDLIPGEIYRRTDLHKRFRGQQQGGISTPANYPVILLFTGDQGALYGYHDGFQEDDDIFLYTGEGQIGDMQMLRGNWAIRNHQETGKELHLFLYVARGMVQYVGQAYYVGHHTRPAPDRNGEQRSAIVFELSVDAPAVGVPDLHPVDRPAKLSSYWQQPMAKLRDSAYAASTKIVPAAARKVSVHHRSEAVRVYVLRRAAGFCEGCDQPAPFKTPQGIPYLEPHHIRRRADAGPDHPRWVIALCPNCHTRVHYSADGIAYNIALSERVEEIEDALPISAAILKVS